MSDSGSGANGHLKLVPTARDKPPDNPPSRLPPTQPFVHTKRLMDTPTVLIQPLVEECKVDRSAETPPPLPVPPRTPTDSGVPPRATERLEEVSIDLDDLESEEWKPEIGVKFRSLKIEAHLGAGGMGSVFRCWDESLNRNVAVKFLLGSQSPGQTQALMREARAMAQCVHEHIVTILYVGQYKGVPYIVMQLVKGRTLYQVAGNKPMPYREVASILLAIAQALACANAENLVHRDIKPSNIVFDESSGGASFLKVLDFGVAKTSSPKAHKPGSNSSGITGTPPYMSKEAWLLPHLVNHRSDIFSLAVIAWELLVGRNPFDGFTRAEIYEFHKSGKTIPSVRTIVPSVPQALSDLIDQGLRPEQDQRPDAIAFAKALEPFKEQASRIVPAFEPSPYVGPSAFQEGDENIFFGRSAITAEILKKIDHQPALCVVGGSGDGKSSQIRAAVLPPLRRSGMDIYTSRPGRAPVETLANILSQIDGSTASGNLQEVLNHQAEIIKKLYEDPAYFGRSLKNHAIKNGRKLVLFEDQGEELALVPDKKELRTALACLESMIEDASAPTKLIMTLRWDALDRISDTNQHFTAKISQAMYVLNPPVGELLKEALQGPALALGYKFETPEIIDEIVAYLQNTRGALPLAAFVMHLLWAARNTKQKLITLASYNSIGRIAGALAKHGETVINELAEPLRKTARIIITQLITSERTRAIVPLNEIYKLSKDRQEIDLVLEHLQKARLITIEKNSVEIVHESLIQGCPTIKAWVSEISPEDAIFLDKIRSAALPWLENRKDSKLPWANDSEMVAEARLFLKRQRSILPEAHEAFLEATIACANKVKRRKRAAIFAVFSVMGLVIAGGSISYASIQRARKNEARQTELARISLAAEKTARLEATRETERAEYNLRKKETAMHIVEERGVQLEQINDRLKEALNIAQIERENAMSSANRERIARANEVAIANHLRIALQQEKARVRELQSEFGNATENRLNR